MKRKVQRETTSPDREEGGREITLNPKPYVRLINLCQASMAQTSACHSFHVEERTMQPQHFFDLAPAVRYFRINSLPQERCGCQRGLLGQGISLPRRVGRDQYGKVPRLRSVLHA